ncbi:MAG: hypothetical protein NTV54_15545 [Ignavibacteriales bacterium]|nr:hypothetical protein [Ignavibacteriales bacterium]
MASPVSSSTSAAVSSVLSSSGAKIYDKRDLNKDGKVTDIEKLRYEMKHPSPKGKPAGKKDIAQNVQTYNQQGKSANSPTGGILDALD